MLLLRHRKFVQQIRLFIDSSKTSLKTVLLHNDNIYPSVPIAYRRKHKKTYDIFKTFLLKINYNGYKWHICGDLKVIVILMSLQSGYTKYYCFLCEWDSRARSDHYNIKTWPLFESFLSLLLIISSTLSPQVNSTAFLRLINFILPNYRLRISRAPFKGIPRKWLKYQFAIASNCFTLQRAAFERKLVLIPQIFRGKFGVSKQPLRKSFHLAKNNVQYNSLVDKNNIYLSPLHIKLEITKKFVKGMDKNEAAVQYLKLKFPALSEAKIKEGIFIGPQIRTLFKDKESENKMSQIEKNVWVAFKNTCITLYIYF
ncbi:uncharacterized protein LOC143305439 [Osmia lignaria lignaria]|uniref:uncharacterized protein LOC143305439 n=1 Tax=Osmia lignaria lignaria TaxID=1437193 RepID=UPI00402B6465